MGYLSRQVSKRISLPDGINETLDAALDHALRVQRGAVLAYIRRVQDKDPALTPFHLVERLERRYRLSVIGIGAAAGGAAAVPGVGTVASVAASAVELTGFIEATAVFALARAEVQGYEIVDPAMRRALVVAVLLGEAGVQVLEAGRMVGTPWAQILAQGVPRDTVSHVNQTLARHLITRFGAEQLGLAAGRAMPFGIGAAIGGAGNFALARGVIATSRRIFGAPPAFFPPKVIEVRAR